MLGEPDGVVARLVHDGKALQPRLVDRIERHGPVAPAEELQNADFQFFPPASRWQKSRSEGLQDNVQCVLNPAPRRIIVSERCDKLALPMDSQRGEVEWIENVTLPPHHKRWRNARMLAAELRHGIRPHERR